VFERKMIEEFLIQRANKNEWIIRTKNNQYDLCKKIVDIR
jgi:hypothetical protein